MSNLILDIQRRHAEIFRLRLGDKGHKGQPQKLTNAIRVTSLSRAVVAAFVDTYGGEVRPWDAQWQAYLPTVALPVMILPGQSVYQRWEMYRGTVCERRCDGETEELSGGRCLCPTDVKVRMGDKNACLPMTRINVLCPEVAVVGAGSLVSHGMIAAETLPQSVAVAVAALNRGLMVPAVLRIIEHKGKRHYVVPRLEIVGATLGELETGERSPRMLDGGTPSRAPVGNGAKALLTGRPELAVTAPAALAPVASPYDDYDPPRQLAPEREGEGTPAPRASRAANETAQGDPLADLPGSPQLSPSGDVVPSTSGATSSEAHGTEAGTGRGQDSVTAAVPRPPAADPDPGRPFTDDDESLIPIDRQRDFARAVSAWTKERYPGPGITKTTEAVRHAIVRHATNGRTDSSKAILHTEMSSLMGTFAALKDGRLVTDVGDDGVIVLVPAKEGEG